MTRSVCSVVVTVGALARVTVTDPPPAGTAADPDAFTVPLLTVTWSVAVPHAAGRPPTVTLMTVPADRFWKTVSPAAVHRGVATWAVPRESEVTASDAAAPALAPVALRSRSPRSRRNIWSIRAGVTGSGGRIAARAKEARYPLMTTLMPVTDVAESAGAKVATMVVPAAGVVPVASPSEALAAPDRVIL